MGPIDPTPGVVIVFSGGLDSTALLYRYLKLGHAVFPISFNYGQRHKIELQYAAATCKLLKLDHEVVDLYSLRDVLSGSALTSFNVDVPHGNYDEESMKSTVVPNRNMIMLSIAAGYAVSLGAQFVATAIHAGDHAVYPDCRPEFLASVNQCVKVANEGFIRPDFEVVAPFVHRSKSDIVTDGTRNGVPWEMTWSCYQGESLHCSRCGTCVERIEAFVLAGVDDPTEYADMEHVRRLRERIKRDGHS